MANLKEPNGKPVHATGSVLAPRAAPPTLEPVDIASTQERVEKESENSVEVRFTSSSTIPTRKQGKGGRVLTELFPFTSLFFWTRVTPCQCSAGLLQL